MRPVPRVAPAGGLDAAPASLLRTSGAAARGLPGQPGPRVGVGAVAATTITLIATGVFESRPTESRFVAGGVRVE